MNSLSQELINKILIILLGIIQYLVISDPLLRVRAEELPLKLNDLYKGTDFISKRFDRGRKVSTELDGAFSRPFGK